MDDERATWFAVTSGRVTGYLGLLAGVVILVIGVMDGSAAGILVGLLFAGLSWMVLLRPRVGTRGEDLLIRGMASTVVIPLASVESVVARQVLSVGVGDRHYVSAAVGHALRDLNRTRRKVDRLPLDTTHDVPVAQDKYADEVVEILTERSRSARRDGAPMGPVRREWAWPELAGLGVLVVALVVALAL
jgi:hypothetical protein